jgi:DNA-binding NarL/FixJ family response regulator
MIRVAMADDHPILRRGITEVLAKEADMKLAGEANDGLELLSLVRKSKFDIVILDISMPRMGGLDVLRQLKSEFPKLPVLILSVHPEDQYAVRVIKMGASGYLTKDSATSALVQAIRLVVAGRKYISPSLAERLAAELASSDRPPHQRLSNREYEILCLIASGKTRKEIADKLSLSVKTISTYRAKIMEKMNLATTADLTSYALREKLIA